MLELFSASTGLVAGGISGYTAAAQIGERRTNVEQSSVDGKYGG